jgi:protein ImuA
MCLAGILARIAGPIFWCLRWRDLFAPALDFAGMHLDRVIHVDAGSDTNVLLATEECLRQPGLAGVVGEVAKPSTTASKRLQLAAEGSSVTAFIFCRTSPADALAEGTAAVTRWRITASPSEQLDIPSLGRARWHVALERVRGAEPRSWIMEVCNAQDRFALPADLADQPDPQAAWPIAV